MISVQNTDDNEFFKWCLVRYLNPADRNPRRITKADKDFEKGLDLKYIKNPVKVRDIHKIEKKRILSALVYLVMKIKKKEKEKRRMRRKKKEKKTLCSYQRFQYIHV